MLEPEPGAPLPAYQPGDYLQLDIPAYGEIRFREIDVPAAVRQGLEGPTCLRLVAQQNAVPTAATTRSPAIPPRTRQLRFNVRIATPPRGQDCPAGVGSAYVHRLKPGDKVTAIGPFGDFHIKPGRRKWSISAAARAWPRCARTSRTCFETEHTTRRVSFWYGARSRQEIFYQDYFEDLARQHPNFSFHLALSEPLPEDNWTGPTGYIHEVLAEAYLNEHADPAGIEYYLCGPPVMVQAAIKMLEGLNVPASQIAFDEF